MKTDIETTLESFIKNEISATEARITAIRSFVDMLKAELMGYTKNLPTKQDEKEQLLSVLKLFRNMISTYDEELKLLMKKRERMLDHLLDVRSVVLSLHTEQTAHIN